jgi:hypothetical protein
LRLWTCGSAAAGWASKATAGSAAPINQREDDHDGDDDQTVMA